MSLWNRGAIALALGLVGCAAGPDFKRPLAPTVGSFQMAGDKGGLAQAAPVAGAWWRAFGSEKLNAVMSDALQNNNDLAEANATLNEARAQESAERGGALPHADANAGVVRERINTTQFGITGFPSPTLTLYSIGGSVGYDVDPFGARRRRIESAAARAEAEGQRAQAAYLTLTGRVARQAFLIAALRAQVGAAESVVAQDRANTSARQRAEAAGGGAHTITETAQSQLAADLALVPALQTQLAQARHGLAALVGHAPGEWAAPDFDLSDFTPPTGAPQTLPSQLVRSRPDILAAEADLHQATADIGVATAALYPDLSLTGALTQSALQTSTLFNYASSGWNFGPSITAPIFHGGTLRANKRAAEARANQALARYKRTVLEAFVQVADVMESLARDDEEVDALVQAERTSGARLRTAHLGFDRGGLTYLDVLDAQRQHDRAVSDLAGAQGRRLQDFALLYVAVGADWRDAPTPG